MLSSSLYLLTSHVVTNKPQTLLSIGDFVLSFLKFVGLFILISIVVNQISGWRNLARFYKTLSPPPLISLRSWCSIKFNYFTYGHCVNVGISDYGLYLAVMVPWGIGAPKLLIPWNDISKVEVIRPGTYTLTLGIPKVAEFSLSKDAVKEVEQLLESKRQSRRIL